MARLASGRISGFTVIEITVAIFILSILFVGIFLSYRPLMAKAEAAACMSKMRGIHGALASYIRDRGQWPQPPEGLWQQASEDAFEDWWITEMEPFGLEPRDWQCPTGARFLRSKDQDRPRMHYSPTPFDAKPFTPFRWATQPWLIEIGNMHGRGAHILFPDGSFKVMSDFMPATQNSQ